MTGGEGIESPLQLKKLPMAGRKKERDKAAEKNHRSTGAHEKLRMKLDVFSRVLIVAIMAMLRSLMSGIYLAACFTLVFSSHVAQS